ncbi:SDR family NAD(P)-dependent oxidoreductase [Croceicoccus bisphenolivorans]|uniref:SDR family NAD(P)-dependent oxidoreductase n=1 Tax=Croceicoccus bisphenolivorans TaxID=1783232 RepID=UPI000830AC30|nr:SDR family NAD(P)-dependent oxidoreductase [Croceicoccus bisphenolivorans]
MVELTGKVAIVTGGGRGIGRSHALALAKAGATVVVNDFGKSFSGEGEISSGPADEVVAEIVATGGKAVADATDISDWDSVKGLIDAALANFGRLDIVVNNAGISRFGRIDAITGDDWIKTIATVLTGTAAVSHWASRHWREKGPEAGRRIINTTSGVGLTPIPDNPMYVAGKAGVAGITISSAMELAELGVRVNAIAPVARSRISEHVAGDLVKAPEQGFDRMNPDHVSALMLYLASSDCRFTGRVLGVIGDDITLFDGWTISQHMDNGENSWGVEELAAALAKWPVQQQGTSQAGKGVMPNPTPAQPVLDALSAIENA